MKKTHYAFGITAALSTVLCAPCLLAPFLIAAGLGSGLLLLTTWFVPLIGLLAVVSLFGFILSYRKHKSVLPLLGVFGAAALVYYGNYVIARPVVAYAGLVLFVLAVIYDWSLQRRCDVACAVLKTHATPSKRSGV